MPVHVRFSFLGEEQINRTMEAFGNRAKDMRPAWDMLRARFISYEEAWFGSEGEGEWPSLSHDYATWKARHFPGKPILQREGDLLKSVTKPDIDVREASYAIFGTGDPVAGYHQRGEGNLPIRRVIDLDDAERVEWVRTVQDYLVKGDDQ